MFRRLEKSLPSDVVVPQTLEELGYSINKESQIRSKVNPEEEWVYKVSPNWRYNDMRCTSMNNAIRDYVIKRMALSNIDQLFLPQLVTTQPIEQSLPIYCTPLDQLKNKSRIIILMPNDSTNLGIWSYKDIFGGKGVNSGSIVSLVKLLTIRGTDSPGLIVLNPNEMYYSHEFKRSFTNQEWQDRPKKSLLHPSHLIDDKWNRISGNETPEKHLQFVMEKIIANSNYVQSNTKIDFIGIMGGGEKVLEYLNVNWSTWNHRVSTISLTHTWQSRNNITSKRFEQFLQERSRLWMISQAPPNTPIACPSNTKAQVWEQHVLCPIFAGGAVENNECVFPNTQGVMLDWMDEVAKEPEYVNPEFIITEMNSEEEAIDAEVDHNNNDHADMSSAEMESIA